MDFVKLLFDTSAVRVAPADAPFWYTSGMLGPYYINTHFLYGNEHNAKELLTLIDTLKNDPVTCADKLLAVLMNNYHSEPIFRDTIDGMIATLTAKHPKESIDYISGGERRDWIFSLPIAHLLNIPHITMFKDLSYQIFPRNSNFKFQILNSAPCPIVVHIADLLNTASSYERAWLPILKRVDMSMTASLVVVDRDQGGDAFMHAHNIDNLACVTICKALFIDAHAAGYINSAQLDMVSEYIDNPKKYMRDFMSAHPQYIDTAKDTALSRKILGNLWGCL